MNHSLQYQADDGTNSNVIESFFSRVEKAYKGINHRFSTKYLDWYMAMLSWKEYTRYAIVHHGRRDKGVHLLQKPFSIKDLAVRVRSVLDL